jgi:dTDP-glucose 4,6-dehydratase
MRGNKSLDNQLSDDLNHILDHTRELWDELRGQRIFISGGTGFFGCWVLESFIWANDLLNLGSHATILTRSPQSFRTKAPHLAQNKAITLLKGDIRTFKFPSGTFSHILHCATESSSMLNDTNPLLLLDTIVIGTRHFLDFSIKCGARKFLLTSSGAVYGKQPPEITHLPEDYKGAPDSLDINAVYGQGKRLAEQLCCIYANSFFEIKVARCFAFVGPYLPLDVHFAIGNFIGDGLKGGPIMIKGDGTPHRSYMYAADLAIWLWTILFKGQSKRAYNVGNDIDLTIQELANNVAQEFDPRIEILMHGIPDPAKPTERYVPSIQRAKTELGLKPLVDLQRAIKKTIAFKKLHIQGE